MPSPGDQIPPKKRGGCLKIGLIVVAVIIVLGIVGAAIGGGDDGATTPSPATQAPQPVAVDTPQATATPTPTAPEPDPEPTVKPLTKAQVAARYKNSCKRISFKLLNRDADFLVGKRYKISGQVMQIRDAGSGNYWTGFPEGVEPRTQMLVSVTNNGYGFWDDNVAVVYDGRLAKVFEEDVIKVWGECLGQYTYESVAGYNITVPAIHAKYVSQ